MQCGVCACMRVCVCVCATACSVVCVHVFDFGSVSVHTCVSIWECVCMQVYMYACGACARMKKTYFVKLQTGIINAGADDDNSELRVNSYSYTVLEHSVFIYASQAHTACTLSNSKRQKYKAI